MLIFTEYRRTQRYLVGELERKYGKGTVVVIHGGMKLERREEADETSTRSGRRSQAMGRWWRRRPSAPASDCSATTRRCGSWYRRRPAARASTFSSAISVVNYDLPWNPMRVEQRGRPRLPLRAGQGGAGVQLLQQGHHRGEGPVVLRAPSGAGRRRPSPR